MSDDSFRRQSIWGEEGQNLRGLFWGIGIDPFPFDKKASLFHQFRHVSSVISFSAAPGLFGAWFDGVLFGFVHC